MNKPRIRAYSGEYYLFCFWGRGIFREEIRGLSVNAKSNHIQRLGLETAIHLERSKQSLN